MVAELWCTKVSRESLPVWRSDLKEGPADRRTSAGGFIKDSSLSAISLPPLVHPSPFHSRLHLPVVRSSRMTIPGISLKMSTVSLLYVVAPIRLDESGKPASEEQPVNRRESSSSWDIRVDPSRRGGRMLDS